MLIKVTWEKKISQKNNNKKKLLETKSYNTSLIYKHILNAIQVEHFALDGKNQLHGFFFF